MKKKFIQVEPLIEFGLSEEMANNISFQANQFLKKFSAEEAWQNISKKLLNPSIPFQIHFYLFEFIFPNWLDEPESAPAWIPDENLIKKTHLAKLMAKLKISDMRALHSWSVNHYEKFWEIVIKQLNIIFHKKPEKICDLREGIESPQWFPGAKLNIIASCFTAPANKTAIIYENNDGLLQKLTFGDLNLLSNRVANSLVQQGYRAGDAIAIDMPMNYLAIAIYLGIIKMGGVVVSIADSFAKDEIAMRLRIANTKAIFTQDFTLRNEKQLPLYEKIVAAQAPQAFVLPLQEKVTLTLRPSDLDWDTFLVADNNFQLHNSEPMENCNILFSSGTTGEPKAIPWNHTTAIKAAADAFYHHDIQPDDVLAWSTNLGWMMGPWLIFAALMNQATIAIFNGLPNTRAFGQFIEKTKVTMLGVVPTLVANWRQTRCMEGLNWEAIRRFSSTGECSNPEDMFYLMFLAGYKPVIEYCGGTEIGGSYITSTLIEKNYPSLFSTPALGLNFTILDEQGRATENGEVAIIPPSIGLSTQLINGDHSKVYFNHMPKTLDGKKLRRHGDQIRKLPNGYYSVLGRVDDTMNLSSIKISSAEIERVLVGINDIIETAAIGITPSGHGPSRLIIYAATHKNLDKEVTKKIMQEKINQHLNPLFKIEDLVFINELPKTASNKIMRRTLRNHYIGVK